WTVQGLLSEEEHGFHYTPDVANYCAWYCADPKTGLPREKSFFDYRLELFPRDVVSQYVGLRQALVGQEQSDLSSLPINWQDIFRKQKITHVVTPNVVLNRNEQERRHVWLILLRDWQQWPLLDISEGRTAIFRWQD